MTENYDDFYKVFGCGTTQKKCDRQCVDRECKTNNACANTTLDFCYEPAECNECIVEHTGYAQAYVPYQEDFTLFSPEEALCHGTIFPVLVQPYRKKRYSEERCC